MLLPINLNTIGILMVEYIQTLQYYRAEFSNNGFECLANIILPMELVATILENTG